jgi:hypothetical protein
VFTATDLHLIAAAGRPPNEFTIRFGFQTPFIYDRRTGDLVLESEGGGTFGRFQGFDASTDANEGLYLLREPFGRVTSRNSVPVTEFQYVAVPEPRAWAIVGLAWFILKLRRNMENR